MRATVCALSAIADLHEKRGDDQGVAAALEREIPLTEGTERVEIAQRLAQIYEGPLNDPRGAIRALDIVHAGDSRVYQFRGAEMMRRTVDHSFVQRLIDEGKITEESANSHPQSNLLTGCLGTHADPPVALWHIDRLEFGDTMLACSDGLWHYFTPKEIGAILHALPPREASEMLISKARQRARGGGDNLSLALVRIDLLR